jgi:hypothetical protein
VICHIGASLLEIKETGQHFGTAQGDTPLKGEITCFSQKSRQRLRMDLPVRDEKERPVLSSLTFRSLL